MERSFRVPMAVLAKNSSQGWQLYEGDCHSGFKQMCTCSYVNQEMMMAKEISSEDRNRDWGHLKSPMIMFGLKSERYNPVPTALHSGAFNSNEADTRI